MKFFFIVLTSLYAAYASIIEEKVLICGLAKNIERQLPHTIKNLEEIASLFSDYKIIVYENNSTDRSKKILHSWSLKNNKVFTLHERFSKEKLLSFCRTSESSNKPSRIEILSMCRNKMLNLILSDSHKDYKYIMIFDMDLKFSPSFKDEVIDIFHKKDHWDAVFANTSIQGFPNKMYDIYAFRNKQLPLGPEFLPKYWTTCSLSVGAVAIKAKQERRWIPVYSAFGGCGIYKKEAMKGCSYSALANLDVELFTKKIMKNPLMKKNYWIENYYEITRKISKKYPVSNIASILNDLTYKTFSPTTRLHRMFCFSKEKDPLYCFGYKEEGWFPIICEHVTFHYKMIENGYNRLFLNPNLCFETVS